MVFIFLISELFSISGSLDNSSVAISFSTAMASFTTSISTNGIPCLTMSPTAMFIDLTMPLTEAGISIAALSVSNIMIESSESIT